MPKQLDQIAEQEDKAVEQEGSGMDQDTEIAIRLGIKMLSEGGLEQIKNALNQSKDPAQVIGSFLAQMIGHMAEQLQKQVNLSPRIFLSKGGFLDHILDYIEVKLGYPSEFSDQIYAAVLETVKAAAMSEAGVNRKAPPQQAAPAGPALDQPAPGGM